MQGAVTAVAGIPANGQLFCRLPQASLHLTGSSSVFLTDCVANMAAGLGGSVTLTLPLLSL